jgi:guanosine-3',5'-bis(diphosphate) 3'-pyrophosphohydrolase
MILTDRQSRLFDFVKESHGDQKRKYTGAPYWIHLLSVAEIVYPYSSGFMEVEIALCHDLIEDTKATYDDLEKELVRERYNLIETRHILKGVEDLTDVYTHEAYPNLNRQKRKALEAVRLLDTSPYSQTVKYADILDNSASIAEHDPGFARIYISEIAAKITEMDKGNPELYKRCLFSIEQIKGELKNSKPR